MKKNLLFVILSLACVVNMHAQNLSAPEKATVRGEKITANWQDQTPDTYQNPVIAGDFPDPTIIRVGNTYYAAGTSGNSVSCYPLYESTDLINWKKIGHIFNEHPSWASSAFWAPELYYKDGTYFAYYTAKRKSDRVSCIGVATTKDIHKGFTDQGIIIDWGEEAIDAFVFQDDDNKTYIVWKAYGLTKGRQVELLCSELSDDGLHLVGEHFTFSDYAKGWKGGGDDEGPCLTKHDGTYYLFYSNGGCCDSRCNYCIRVARSKNLRSGWEQLPEPILQGSDVWRCPGHGTLVMTQDNRYFYMYHSFNVANFGVGRQGMLDELVWDKQTGWPIFKNGNTPSVKAPVPFKKTKQ